MLVWLRLARPLLLLAMLRPCLVLRSWQVAINGDANGGFVGESWGTQNIEVLDEQDGITMQGANRVYVIEDWVWSHTWREVRYKRLRLLNKAVSFTVDLSGVNCGCNAAIYLVQMPFPEYSSSDSSEYCDIQGYEQGSEIKPCLEIDLLEGNAKAVQSTLHTTSGHGNARARCNQDGCYANLGKEHGDGRYYGPGASVMGGIDSNHPFRVTAAFPETVLPRTPHTDAYCVDTHYTHAHMHTHA